MRPGDMVHQFELERELGKGGGGKVWLVQDSGRGKPAKYAMKVCTLIDTEDLQGAQLEKSNEINRELKVRFKREVELLTNYRSLRGVVGIEPYYEIDSHPYFYLMELADGDLDHYLRCNLDKELSTLIRELQPIVSALSWLHSEGHVHRDVKPGNVLFSPRGFLLADFGVAKMHGSPLTSQGSHIGTHFFVAPEQLRNPAGVTGHADQFSLAALVLWCINCRSKEPDDWPLVPNVKRILQRAFKPDPLDRFDNIEEFHSSLVVALEDNPPMICSGWKSSSPERGLELTRIADHLDPLQYKGLDDYDVFFTVLSAELGSLANAEELRAARDAAKKAR